MCGFSMLSGFLYHGRGIYRIECLEPRLLMRVTVLLKELREPRPKPLQSPKQTEAQGTKENTGEHGFIETKTFCASKDTSRK